MKKKLFCLTLLLGFIVCLLYAPKTVQAAGDVAINETNFPDTNFRSYVSDECDSDGDGVLSSSEIAAVISIYISEKDIADLKGIEHFTALEQLYCTSNQLTKLDVSKNTALQYLFCDSNQLTSLDVSGCVALDYLQCSSNQLTSLDVSNNMNLMFLYCYNNQLTSLDVTKNTHLDDLYCYGNKISYVDISSCFVSTYAFNMGDMIQGTDFVRYIFWRYDSDLRVDYDTVVIDSYPTRIYGANRYQTSIQIAEKLKEVLGVEKFENIVLVSGKDFPDGLSASYLAAKYNAPILTTSTNEKYYKGINEYVLNNLAEGGTVYVIGGQSAVSDASIKDLSGVKCERYEGKNRYGTNLAILKACGVEAGSEVLIATGKSFPDSLSVSSTGLPLFLMNGEKGIMNDEQKSYLKILADNGCTFTIIGGTGAVSEAAETLIKQVTGKTPDRVAGGNRYTTSTAIADRYFPETNQVVLGYGQNFPDALCAGPLGAALKAPVILTRSGKNAVNASTEYTGSHGTRTVNGIHKGYVLGGKSLIPDEVVRTILGLNKSIPILEN